MGSDGTGNFEENNNGGRGNNSMAWSWDAIKNTSSKVIRQSTQVGSKMKSVLNKSVTDLNVWWNESDENSPEAIGHRERIKKLNKIFETFKKITKSTASVYQAFPNERNEGQIFLDLIKKAIKLEKRCRKSRIELLERTKAITFTVSKNDPGFNELLRLQKQAAESYEQLKMAAEDNFLIVNRDKDRVFQGLLTNVSRLIQQIDPVWSQQKSKEKHGGRISRLSSS